MAHFYASIQGSAKTQGTRCGTKTSGISGHLRGWNSGVRVYGGIDENGNDWFRVYATSGSTGGEQDKLLAEVTDNEIKMFRS